MGLRPRPLLRILREARDRITRLPRRTLPDRTDQAPTRGLRLITEPFSWREPWKALHVITSRKDEDVGDWDYVEPDLYELRGLTYVSTAPKGFASIEDEAWALLKHALEHPSYHTLAVTAELEARREAASVEKWFAGVLERREKRKAEQDERVREMMRGYAERRIATKISLLDDEEAPAYNVAGCWRETLR